LWFSSPKHSGPRPEDKRKPTARSRSAISTFHFYSHPNYYNQWPSAINTQFSTAGNIPKQMLMKSNVYCIGGSNLRAPNE